MSEENRYSSLKRAVSLEENGQLEEALKIYNQLAVAFPSKTSLWKKRGALFKALGLFQKSIHSYTKALAIDPDDATAHFGLGLMKIATGDWEEGWPHYEWRWRLEGWAPFRDRFSETKWTGQDLAGKTILLYGEQGYGDVIWGCRYLEKVKALGPKIIIAANSPLVRLLSAIDPEIKVIAKSDPLPFFDYQCPLMSLPATFKTTLKTLPAKVPYLVVKPEWLARLPPKEKLRIGVAWYGSGRYEGREDLRRDIPLEIFGELLTERHEFYSLHKEARPQDKEFLDSHRNIHTTLLSDFAETAALIDEMDLIISVDTAVAHIAGALAKPAWILLPHPPDYLSLVDREDNPSYPTARLFRQPTAGDWESVIAKVNEFLKGFIKP